VSRTVLQLVVRLGAKNPCTTDVRRGSLPRLSLCEHDFL
jgi:hypothetical protein